MRTTKTEEDERGGRKPTPVLYHGGKFDQTINLHGTHDLTTFRFNAKFIAINQPHITFSLLYTQLNINYTNIILTIGIALHDPNKSGKVWI